MSKARARQGTRTRAGFASLLRAAERGGGGGGTGSGTEPAESDDARCGKSRWRPAAAALSAGPSPLTRREQDVLNTAADGATVADIASRVLLFESTVRNHLSAAIGTTGTRDRMEAVRAARRNGRP